MGEMTIKLGQYEVTRAERLVGIRIFVLHYGTDMILFEYMGQDKAQQMYFFKARQSEELNWVLAQPFDKLNTKTFHPFLLELDKIEEYYANL